jgi:hypothetical protein
MDHSAVIGGLNVAHVGAQQFIGAQAGKQRRQDERAVTFDPVAAPPGLRLRVQDCQQGCHGIGWSPLGSVLASLGRPTNGIALAATSPEVYRNVHKTFHVDQQRCIVAASWIWLLLRRVLT